MRLPRTPKGVPLLGILAFLAACSSPLDCSAGFSVALLGLWNYAATQTSPTIASLSGTLEIAGYSGCAFDGALDVTETDAQGLSRRLTGVVRGRVLDSVSVDFDAFLELDARRHLGTVARDSIRGMWVEALPGGGTSSGSFTTARQSQP